MPRKLSKKAVKEGGVGASSEPDVEMKMMSRFTPSMSSFLPSDHLMTGIRNTWKNRIDVFS